ncbi:MAG: DUF2079 domain-containing protein, partial [Candidatus Parvarchaeota archaeon]
VINNFTSNIDDKVFTFLLLLSPFMMLPLLSRRWTVSILVYVALVFYSGGWQYIFPAFDHLQYNSMIVPFLFLGTIDVLSNFDFKHNGMGKLEQKMKVASKKNSSGSKLPVVLTIFVLIVLLGTVYEPYGPLNKYSETDFNLGNVTNYNISLYEGYLKLVDLIPTNDPFILYQNDMPQVIYRDPVALTYSLFGEPFNYTFFIDGHWTSNVSYIIANPYSSYFTYRGEGNYSLDMYNVVSYYISVKKYGILGEWDGIILLKRSYSGPPIVYAPEDRNFSAQNLYVLDNSYRASGIITSSQLTNGETLWYGPYTVLQPGTYELTLHVKASNISSRNSFILRYSYYNPSGALIDISLLNITGEQFSRQNYWTNISIDVIAPNLFTGVEFAGQSFHWSGNFAISGISLKQISYYYP